MTVPTTEVSSRLHPLIYRIAIGLAVWLLTSAWWFFDGPGYIKLVLGMISVLVTMAIGIPYALSRAYAHNAAPETDAPRRPQTFAAWLHGGFDTWTGVCRSATAAIEILLPIGAVAFGMTAFGIVFLIARSGAH
jgi:hypothetical protein